MRLKSMMLLALAAGCGLVAMLLFQQAKNANARELTEKLNILVAKAEVTPGETLDEENVEFREFPVSFAPDNAVTTLEEYQERSTKVKLFLGDFVTLDKLTRKGEKGSTEDIPSGMVLISIPVDVTMTSSGLLLPGDRVDVFVTFTMRTPYGSGKVVKTVLEFVEVFATDHRRGIESTTDEKEAKTVTLLATPKQAMRVKLAEDVGKLHLAMRSKEDSKNRAGDDDLFSPDLLTDFGNDDEEEDEEVEDDSDLGTFIDDNSQPVLEPITDAPREMIIEEPYLPTWDMVIFAGKERRVESVPLPLDDLELIEDTLPEDDGSTGNPLLDGLKMLFGKKDDKQPGDRTPTSANDESPVPGLPANSGLIQDGYPELGDQNSAAEAEAGVPGQFEFPQLPAPN
jgi:pilus assembly protein CpaB